jgi:hypothetical protein
MHGRASGQQRHGAACAAPLRQCVLTTAASAAASACCARPLLRVRPRSQKQKGLLDGVVSQHEALQQRLYSAEVQVRGESPEGQTQA